MGKIELYQNHVKLLISDLTNYFQIREIMELRDRRERGTLISFF